ncbi:Aste57867_23654 [Aphanomyces stellatus]|uniref:Aste57867_23654 protein n=1 Tax=Aphanomyces stellatus TaxID=120398 RepID=A0A485LQ48_9STRA|nr:hypothetical protein As57867_023582 [Aphanomyces stellatus]VFU00299.1 Aste57867_23654 [Aphanomyces stellatus]
MMEPRSKKEEKRLQKKRAREEKKASAMAEGTWTSARKRRNQRDFHNESRDSIDVMQTQTTTETRADGFRYVAPYEHTFQVYVKARWFGKTLLQMFVEEFGGYSDAYYTAAIEHCFITLNGQRSTAATLVKDGDLLQHTTHRHEPRVQVFTEAMIEFESDDIIVVNKPSTIPVHPCGAYRHNSMVFLLAKDFSRHPLFPVHRLDRLTSGLLVLAKTPEKAQVLSAQLIDRTVQKYYWAKVDGGFPSIGETTENEAALASLRRHLPPCATISIETHASIQYFKISAPLQRIADLENRHGIHAEGKLSETLVRLVVNVDGTHSILECLPLTGRQHQIRVHLQGIGFPIANDPLYGPSAFVDAILSVPGQEAPVVSSADTTGSLLRDICPSCQGGDGATFNWEQLHCQGIWLHAFRYKGQSWDVSVASPPWAPNIPRPIAADATLS